MADHGIMFKAEMIQAYMRGDKWQTRRTKGLDVVNQSPDEYELLETVLNIKKDSFFAVFRHKKNGSELSVRFPYGYEMDTLWFKETYALMCKEAEQFCYDDTVGHVAECHYVEYRADTGNLYPGDWPAEEARGYDEAPKWKSSMFMPKKYSRFLDVVITGAYVERLLDITWEDAVAEGIPHTFPEVDREQYFQLWDQINAKRGLSAKINPWVFVYEFNKRPNSKVLGHGIHGLMTNEMMEDIIHV